MMPEAPSAWSCTDGLSRAAAALLLVLVTFCARLTASSSGNLRRTKPLVDQPGAMMYLPPSPAGPSPPGINYAESRVPPYTLPDP